MNAKPKKLYHPPVSETVSIGGSEDILQIGVYSDETNEHDAKLIRHDFQHTDIHEDMNHWE